MKKRLLFLLALSTQVGFISAQQTDLYHLSSFNTGVSQSAEVVTYDPTTQRAFFTSASTNQLSIIDISNALVPTLFLNVDLSPYGGGPNSVAVSNGLVAVAIQNVTKTSNGKVVVFNSSGIFQKEFNVGALPDMLTFTPDGLKLIVANEGEPNNDYTIDPEGSISIIDLSSGIAGATVISINFLAYNDKKASLINKGVRIFGNNGTATVAQDLEPEYIAITEDGSLAYISCQENNALAIIDLSTDALLDIIPLGYKNHLLGTPTVTPYTLNTAVTNWPSLGTPVYDGGQPAVMLGGFSGLFYADNESSATSQVFYAVPDRGPNASSVKKANVTPTTTQNLRPFKLPNYQSRISKFTINRTTGNVTLDNTILLFRQDGTTPITGKGNIPGVDEVPVTYADAATAYPNSDYTDNNGETYHELPYDEFGGDLEGVLKDKQGNFWMCDEYRPAIYKFQANGTLIDRYVASGTSLLGTTPMAVGTYGNETLPAIYAKRRANRGFEAIAYDSINEVIYTFIQTPLYNPSSVTKNNSDVIRILGIDANTGSPVAEYVYLLERNKDSGYSSKRVDKIGDAVYTGGGKFLVIERDSEGPTVETAKKFVFEIDINGATNILGTTISTNDGSTSGSPLETLTADEIVNIENIVPVHKLKVVNLPSVGYQGSDKAEGIALLPNNEIAILNDNDFGLAGAGTTDNSVLGIISFANNYGFDASNKDNIVNITAHPTLGMFMPDGIASYAVNGKNYIVTANEGDSRDYDGYSEEERVRDLILDAVAYPNHTALQENAALGRLKTTTATGDYDNDGEIEQIYSYGARSFSIFDQYGNLVFDSGNEISQTVLLKEPLLFNEDNAKLDGRSDDKGAEPEAVAIGTINGFTYAFIGLERQSAIMVYDITNPKTPQFITYYNNRTVDGAGDIHGDVAPEIIKFIAASDSPNGENLLLVGYERSGSMGILQIGGTLTSISKDLKESKFKIYPNPLSEVEYLNFDIKISGKVIDLKGNIVMTFQDVKRINTNGLSVGMYIINSVEKGGQRFLKIK